MIPYLGAVLRKIPESLADLNKTQAPRQAGRRTKSVWAGRRSTYSCSFSFPSYYRGSLYETYDKEPPELYYSVSNSLGPCSISALATGLQSVSTRHLPQKYAELTCRSSPTLYAEATGGSRATAENQDDSPCAIQGISGGSSSRSSSSSSGNAQHQLADSREPWHPRKKHVPHTLTEE